MSKIMSMKLKGTYKKDREEYLEASAQLLCKAAYKMCKEYFGPKTSAENCNPKFLKEACSAVKEAVTLSSGIENGKEVSSEEIRISFSLPEEYTD